MTKTSSKKDKDGDTDRSLFSKIVEGIIVFFICALLLKLGICYLLSVRVPLLVTAGIVAGGIIAYRMYKWKRRHDDY